MKTKDIAQNYSIDQNYFEFWLKQSGYSFKAGPFGGIEVNEGQDIGEMVEVFKRFHSEQWGVHQQAESERQAAEQLKQQAMSRMLITSGFSFDGYTITKYSGYISGDDAVQIPRGSGGFFGNVTDVGASLMASLVQIRRNALIELKEAAYALGCNAVIGVDFDYLTLDPETVNSGGGTLYLPYVFGVTANGNAVIIEKNDRTVVA